MSPNSAGGGSCEVPTSDKGQTTILDAEIVDDQNLYEENNAAPVFCPHCNKETPFDLHDDLNDKICPNCGRGLEGAQR